MLHSVNASSLVWLVPCFVLLCQSYYCYYYNFFIHKGRNWLNRVQNVEHHLLNVGKTDEFSGSELKSNGLNKVKVPLWGITERFVVDSIETCVRSASCVPASHISSDISHPAEATLGPSARVWEPQHGVITAQGSSVECQLKDTLTLQKKTNEGK